LDYKEVFTYAEFWRNDVAPNLQHLTPRSINFTEYLQGFYKTSIAATTFGIPLPYIYSLEWLKRFKRNCISFFYNSPDEVAKGASVLSVIYQLSSKMHTLSNIHVWMDEGKGDGHVTSFIIYEDFKDILTFAEKNLDIVKQPKAEHKGFSKT